MRFGLVGTGHWARTTHAPALRATNGVDLVAVWGRDPRRTATLAAAVGARPYDDVEAMFDAVDAVAFAVAPDVQALLARRAAARGRHLLLEKPIALSRADAAALQETVEDAGVSSVVFFASRFRPERRNWLEQAQRETGWEGGWVHWLASALELTSPYTDSPWRQVKGGLWDVGPHALSLLVGALGPITAVAAAPGPRDVTHLILRHADGASSTATLSIRAPRAAAGVEVGLWGSAGVSRMPTAASPSVDALTIAVRELVADARAGVASHPCGVALGRHIVDVLADAEDRLASAA